ncbi:MAG TPA: TadE/TadG family type IV pilus assembly protein [Vicinamibacterales bacterium]|nr:TadE/TadG family type IV pilus assembly protein [Vicinamibacterales bacterium]
MKRFKSQKGAALIEAAVTVPIILLISVGIFEFGRAYQTQQVLTNAAREGARLAVIEGTTDAEVRTRVRDYLKGGGLKDLSDSQIPISRTVALTGTTTASSVEIDYPFEFMVLNPVVRLVAPADTTTGGPITMKASTLMRNE